jgi:hypothetical protein
MKKSKSKIMISIEFDADPYDDVEDIFNQVVALQDANHLDADVRAFDFEDDGDWFNRFIGLEYRPFEDPDYRWVYAWLDDG